MKTNKGFILPLFFGIIVLLIIGGGVYVYKNKKADLPLAEIISESQKSILLTMKDDWQSIQGKIPFRPGHPGTTDWLAPNAVQFISTTSMLINFEDGYTSNLALLNISIPDGEFQILETWKNKSLFTQEEWQEVVNKYGSSAFPVVSTYTVSLVRGAEIISFPELTKVPENVFVKNFPPLSQADTYIYTNHGFSIELPKGFVPEDRLAENGPAYIISLPTGGLTYVTDATWWEKYNIGSSYTYIESQKIGETTFKIYEYSGLRFYWFKQGDVGYEFSGSDNTKLEVLLKTFKFVGWFQ